MATESLMPLVRMCHLSAHFAMGWKGRATSETGFCSQIKVCCDDWSHPRTMEPHRRTIQEGRMQQLLYHAPDNPNRESPFDRAIVQVAQDQEVSIISPYIGLKYLHRLIGISKSWRLISDVLEWLSATPVRERGEVFQFLEEHNGLVHHYPAIHAKTVLSSVGAYTGSANLTDAGVMRRTEFGVLLTDPGQVHEIKEWFDALWNQTSPPPLNSVMDLIAELDQISHVAADFAELKASQLESGARRVRAKLVKILGHEPLTISIRRQQNLDGGTGAHVQPPALGSVSINTLVQTSSPLSSGKIALVKRFAQTLQKPQALLQFSSFDLDTEIAAYVDANAVKSFTFAELFETLLRKSPSLTRRQTYFAILELCASHPRTLFSADACNRLIYREGRFIQSSKELLSAAFKPLDELVVDIIDQLSFDDPSPGIHFLFASGVCIGAQKAVLKGMLCADVVQQADTWLKLSLTAQWSPRLRLLDRAHSRWEARLKQHNLKRVPSLLSKAPAIIVSSSSGPRTQESASEQALALRESALEPQEIQVQKRHDQLDMFFSYLAEMRSTMGEKTKIPMGYLKKELMRESGFSEEDVRRLLNGTYRMYRSPFLGMVIGSGGAVNIVADLDGNPHLQHLPKTRSVIENSPVLLSLQTPARPQLISIARADSQNPVRVRINSYEDADQACLLMVQWIFRTRPSTTPMLESKLITMLEASGVSRDTLRRLMFDRSSRFARLFTLWRKGKKSRLIEAKPGSLFEFSIRLHHASLSRYPNTHSYLKTVVWPSSSEHIWLQSPKHISAALAKGTEIDVLNELRQKHSSRDKAYAKIFGFISRRIAKFERFKTSGMLVTALTQANLDKFVIEFLLGLGHKPPQQLMQVCEDAYGLFIQTDPQALLSYARCTKFVVRGIQQGTNLHPWLTFNAAMPVPASSLPATAAGAPRRGLLELGPLRWDDIELFEIDTLYHELVRLS